VKLSEDMLNSKDSSNDQDIPFDFDSIHFVSLLLTFVAILCIWLHYRFSLQELKHRNMIPPKSTIIVTLATLHSLKWTYWIVLEIAIVGITCPPFISHLWITLLNNDYNISIPLGKMITTLMLFRLYLLIRLIARWSRYNTDKVISLCYTFYVKPTVSFYSRSLLKRKPYIVTICCLVVIVLSMGYAVHVYEQ
jgi:hypothetical protein